MTDLKRRLAEAKARLLRKREGKTPTDDLVTAGILSALLVGAIVACVVLPVAAAGFLIRGLFRLLFDW